jgi:hypothetical protein
VRLIPPSRCSESGGAGDDRASPGHPAAIVPHAVQSDNEAPALRLVDSGDLGHCGRIDCVLSATENVVVVNSVRCLRWLLDVAHQEVATSMEHREVPPR